MRPSSQNLQRNGSDAGNQERLVRRVDVAQLLTACQRFAVDARGVEIRAMKQHFRAEILHRGYLRRISLLRHDDDRAGVKESGRARDGLTMGAG